ncbi:MAG TPA: hypothetical protein VKX41_10945 [Alloacidobacterium sp.]|jgi:hypothetical protein|nr:hypothetical protein [Alloacidobacterium sp.]
MQQFPQQKDFGFSRVSLESGLFAVFGNMVTRVMQALQIFCNGFERFARAKQGKVQVPLCASGASVGMTIPVMR